MQGVEIAANSYLNFIFFYHKLFFKQFQNLLDIRQISLS